MVALLVQLEPLPSVMFHSLRVPLAQDCTPFDAVLAWRGAVPTAALVALLEQGFWPQWHAILAHWLAGAPDHNEVARWYLSWKSRFPQVRRPETVRVRVRFIRSHERGRYLRDLAYRDLQVGAHSGHHHVCQWDAA